MIKYFWLMSSIILRRPSSSLNTVGVSADYFLWMLWNFTFVSSKSSEGAKLSQNFVLLLELKNFYNIWSWHHCLSQHSLKKNLYCMCMHTELQLVSLHMQLNLSLQQDFGKGQKAKLQTMAWFIFNAWCTQ